MSLLFNGFGSVEVGRNLQNDFEIEYAFQRFALEKNAAEFTLAGLRLPSILAEFDVHSFVLDLEAAAPELVNFQVRLDERVGSLSGNHALMRQHWEILERTHEFRFEEFREAILFTQVVEETVNLVNVLTEHRSEQACLILAQRLKRRSDILKGRHPTAGRTRLRLVRPADS